MSKIKVVSIVFLAALIVVGIIIYFRSQPPSEIVLRIFVLNNDYLRNPELDSAFARELTNILLERYNPTDIQVKLYGSAKLPKSEFELKIKPGEPEKVWKYNIFNKLFSIFDDTLDVSLSNESTNELFLDFLEKIKKNSNDPHSVFVFAGSFPNCYNYSAKTELVSKALDFLKKNNFRAKIYSLLINPRKGLERDIIDSLKASNLLEIEEIVIAPDLRRECFETQFPRFFGMFFKKLNYEASSQFLDFVKSVGGDQFVFTLWNDGPKNNTRIIYFDDKIDSTNFINILQGVENASTTSINFLFKQAYHQLAQIPDSIKKHWIIIGNFPPIGDQLILEKDYWSSLKKIKNLVIYHFLPANSKRTLFENKFFEVIQKYYNLKVSLEERKL